ncbi:MAG TPA: DUF3052 domain-containing protein [Gordonia sp. (in: high G+C Gram-positive bacteria)]|uniref:DUF3052 domain-containing protein n=1 Tax=unclassified Gordonia (in: high G+C Gram-positive bacteria) TaxID=2657482 RepID=UPI000FADB0E9|nr:MULTISPECIES: DUF3052 domain-containing protein [unclassified Gordonia (in: high G+C Gram-positive bacteria)]RUP41537.1 MAG: DUF3052 domain-containing protein [Gordonia sp. (in: high G+C Gram-positive bacteria)]HNP56623.1 DUF3052 domain-containing protein [Gordonia sp. (in: high G+C Gram-positive bacteria)]HRC50293.1 DUF3052 domain-containing protein [Gordonia sp. (in: high G+C Gram-positive bacteria)]
MVAADGSGAQRLGLSKGLVVQELGWDDDTDDDLRAAIEDIIDAEMLDEDAVEVIDVVLLWWREDDGDLTDALIEAIGPLADDGYLWVLSPKTGRSGHVEPSEVSEAAATTGLTQTSVTNLGDWTATRLVQPRSRGSR